MVTHTPGPWLFVEQGDANEYALLTADKKGWVIGFLQNGEMMTARQIANARLIAAAPTLLAACQAVLDESPASDGKRIESIKRICREAIAAATVAA